MRIFLHDINILSDMISPGDIIEAVVGEKVGDIYSIKIDDIELYAKSDLELSPGQHLRLKALNLSPSHCVLKIIPQNHPEGASPSRGNLSDMPSQDNTAVHGAMRALAKLDLPATPARLRHLSDLIDHLLSRRDPSDSAEVRLSPSIESNSDALSMHSTNYILDRQIPSDRVEELPVLHVFDELVEDLVKNLLDMGRDPDIDSILNSPHTDSLEAIHTESPVDPPLVSDMKDTSTNSQPSKTATKMPAKAITSKIAVSLSETPDRIDIIPKIHERHPRKTLEGDIAKRHEIIKDYLATKVMSLNCDENDDAQISFFAIPIPLFDTVFLKVERDGSREKKSTPIALSFIIQTHNIGIVGLTLGYHDKITKAQLTFENNSILNMAKAFLEKMGMSANPFLKSIEFRVGKVQIEKFFSDVLIGKTFSGVDIRV